MTTMIVAPIMTPITNSDMCIAAAVSKVGDVGAVKSWQYYILTVNQQFIT